MTKKIVIKSSTGTHEIDISSIVPVKTSKKHVFVNELNDGTYQLGFSESLGEIESIEFN